MKEIVVSAKVCGNYYLAFSPYLSYNAPIYPIFLVNFEHWVFISSFKEKIEIMAFNGTEGGQISLEQGSALTTAYRRENPNKIIARFFGRDILERILAQENCMGIRMYYGIDENGVNELVIVGADQNENDLIDLVADISSPCPHACSQANPLNS